MEKISIIYSFLNITFTLIFIGTSFLYILTFILIGVLKYKSKTIPIDYKVLYNNSVLIYYILSIIWIISKLTI